MTDAVSLTPSYKARRGELETYFDRTAVDAWARLTTTAPVSRIRATVRAGRDSMRDQILQWLPDDLSGRRILDAGCGTGAFAVEAARRGADVLAIDLSATLVSLARERTPRDLGKGSISFEVGDMLDKTLGSFDHVVAMDSLIHYSTPDVVRSLAGISGRTSQSILFTFAPRTLLLGAMYNVGKLFPRSDRSPAIVPVPETDLVNRISRAPEMAAWVVNDTMRVSRGFYTSQVMELRRR